MNNLKLELEPIEAGMLMGLLMQKFSESSNNIIANTLYQKLTDYYVKLTQPQEASE